MCMFCAGKVHIPMYVWSPHRSEVFAHHTALSMPHASITKTNSTWATADISVESQLHSHTTDVLMLKL